MKKILIVETNVAKYANSNRATGLWLGETVHFYDEVIKAGFEVDFVSPNGGYVPIDPHSFKYANDLDYKWYSNQQFVENALKNTLKPSDVKPSDYIAIYYTGGHGVVWDFKDNEELQQIAIDIYNNGGFITSVCHGAAGLINIKNNNDKYLIDSVNVTGFSNLEELINMTSSKVPFKTQDELIKSGANYISKRPFKEHTIIDGRIITGQNPQSAKLVAISLLTALAEYEL